MPFLMDGTTMKAKNETDKRTARVPVMLRASEVEAVDGFRFANRCPSRSEAIRTLMKRGLQAASHEPVKDDADGR